MQINNFQEIPQYIQCLTNFSCTVPLEKIEEQIKLYQNVFGLDLNPDFQRGHVWTKEQQIAFVEHLLMGGKSGRTVYFNDPCWGGGANGGEFVCVDGLQRITACRKFIDNEIKVFGTYYKDFEGVLGNHIALTFEINNLSAKKNVLKWYLQINSGGTPHSKEELTRVEKILKKEI